VALASSPTHKSDLAIAGAVVAWAISRHRRRKLAEHRDALPAVARQAQEKTPPSAPRWRRVLSWR
jgi:ADP-ribosylglycohydrolase